MERKSGGGN
jgi:hypothetical protein